MKTKVTFNLIERRIMKTRAERQRRFFKARAIKFNRKLARMGEKALDPNMFSKLMIEGDALMVFMAMDSLNRKEVNCGGVCR